MTRDEIINNLLLEAEKEFKYWLSEENKDIRKQEVGIVAYQKISTRLENLQMKLRKVIIPLVVPLIDTKAYANHTSRKANRSNISNHARRDPVGKRI